MELIHRLFYQNLDVVFFIYGVSFITMGVTILVQPKRGSEFQIANIFWLLAAFGIIHGTNELFDMWAIIKGRNEALDTFRWLILAVSYLFLFEFGRRLFLLPSQSPPWQRILSSCLQWWLLPLIVIFVSVMGILSDDLWTAGSIWSRYLLGLPGGLLIGLGFRLYYYHEETYLAPLKVKKYFLFGGIAFAMYGILGGIIVPKEDFFPASWLNTESFLLYVKVPVQAFRTACAVTATWAIGGMLTIFNWEIRNKLQTNQVLLKQQLRKSEERYMEIVKFSTDIIYSIDIDGYIISTNKQGYTLLNYEQQNLIAKLFKDISTKETFKKLERGHEKIKREGSVFLGDGQLIKANGDILDVTMHSIAMVDNDNTFLGMRLIIRDITEQRKMEDEIQKIEKLESIGMIAGGIAHDFNNTLTTIAGNISLAAASATDDNNLSEILMDAKKACYHAKRLTNQLLTFSMGGSPIKKVSDIRSLIGDSAKFVLRGTPVVCQVSIDEDLKPVEIDEGQFIQVIHNLVLNAHQSMPKGGTVEIRARNTTVETGGSRHLDAQNQVLLSVTDNGQGIPEKIINKVFDPFFTTKENGSGLGLACTYSIIKNHGGHIEVFSEVGAGTTFNVYLPTAQKPAASAQKSNANGQKSGLILLMDDEVNVRKSVQKMLTYLGYETRTAKNGEEAIELYKKAKDSEHPFDAVIIDLTIREGMGGKDAIEHLAALDPSVKGIVSSGYFNDPIMAEYRQHGFIGVIPKPYEMDALSELLHKVINS